MTISTAAFSQLDKISVGKERKRELEQIASSLIGREISNL